MDPHLPLLAGFGALVLLTAWLPMVLRELPLSLPVVCVGLGAALALGFGPPATLLHPLNYPAVTERMTEAVILVALMGAGLKLDRSLGLAAGALTWRLLVLAMPLTIVVLTGLGWAILGLGLPAALLLAAALAPTDPVLASDVQVGGPGQGQEDEVRFTLTAEAGLNDGLAFPFVHLAIGLALAAQAAQADPAWLRDWLIDDVLWKLAAGLAIGAAIGRALGWLTFRLPKRAKLSRTGDGFVALGITAITYGVTELARGYGFLAVFVAALAFRSMERHHDYHEKLHDFIEQLERLLMMVLLVLLGAAVATGGLLRGVDAWVVAYAAIALLVVRPVLGWVSLSGRHEPPAERMMIAVFGIRGLGTAYYLAYALGHAPFEQPDRLWATAGLIVLVSILFHGTTVTPVIRRLDRRRERREGRPPAAPGEAPEPEAAPA